MGRNVYPSVEATYKIKDTQTGWYSAGGYDACMTRRGKVWKTPWDLMGHLSFATYPDRIPNHNGSTKTHYCLEINIPSHVGVIDVVLPMVETENSAFNQSSYSSTTPIKWYTVDQEATRQKIIEVLSDTCEWYGRLYNHVRSCLNRGISGYYVDLQKTFAQSVGGAISELKRIGTGNYNKIISQGLNSEIVNIWNEHNANPYMFHYFTLWECSGNAIGQAAFPKGSIILKITSEGRHSYNVSNSGVYHDSYEYEEFKITDNSMGEEAIFMVLIPNQGRDLPFPFKKEDYIICGNPDKITTK